jgi:site-specific DNA recombinase
MKRAILYPRVSTDEQAESGYSLPTQLEACRKYAHAHGFEVVAEFAEDYTGTVPIENRPEGSKAYAMLAQDEADALIVYRVDRLVRPPEEGDEWDTPIPIRGLARLGKELHACDRGKLGTNFADLLIAMLDAKTAGDERRKFIERSRRGKYGKARTGKVVGGKTPYGYEHDENGKIVGLIPNEAEAKVVRLIYQWYVYSDGDGEPLSGAAIAKKLSELRIKTPGETRPGTKRVRESGMWPTCQVLEMLKSEKYAGIWRYGTRIGDTRKERPLSEQVEVEIPAIIDRELWEAAQAQRAENKRNIGHRAKRHYLLRGMIQCKCGRSMCGEFYSNHRYYTCTWRNNRHSGLEDRTCYQRSVRADLIEPLAWEYVMGIFSDAAEFERLLRLAQQEEQDGLEPKRHELDTVNAMLAECETEASAYAAELVKKRTGKVREALEAKVQEFEARFEALSKRRDKLQAELAAGSQLDEKAIQAALQFREDVYQGMVNPDQATQRKTFKRLGVQVVVSGKKAKLSCVIPSYVQEVGLDSSSYSPGRIPRAHRFRAMPLAPDA